ncbi:MAG: hypothetical protein B7X37_07155 [Halothiobacillus sp. 14-55-98]|jgi:predicted Zn-dependent protease|nr:MAG: hypothetical protein B7X37_07155 [Halothiobacillus sp. 14-55-98]
MSTYTSILTRWICISSLVIPTVLTADLAFAGTTIAPDAPSLKHQRWQAVDQAKAGQLAEGIRQLQTLAAAHPRDPWITADLIVLLRRDGQNAAICRLTEHLRAADIPSYAWLDWARALRDEKQFGRAAAVLTPYQVD